MTNTIASHYLGELNDWRSLIAFYINEVTATGEKLDEVIRRNSIVHIANKVEEHRDALNNIVKRLKRLRKDIRRQENILENGADPLNDTLITKDIEQTQEELRGKMLALEKEYLDTKYACATFLSDSLKKRP